MAKKSCIKDPGSAITHFVGFLMALFASVPLLLGAAEGSNLSHTIALAIYALSLILLYAASTSYHTFNLSEKGNKRLKKWDHMMIFILIAGTYTPICLVLLADSVGYLMLVIIWTIAVIGIFLKAFWVYCPKWVSSVLYIAMGWVCIFAITQIFRAMPPKAFSLLVVGGVLYTIGGVLYALKLKALNNKFKHFGSHEIFHLFVIAGSVCHFILMYVFVLP